MDNDTEDSSRLGSAISSVRKSIAQLRHYASISRVEEISRRYFVINAYDGAMTMLGIVIGAHVAGNIDPRIVVGAGLGGIVAMGVSGFTGAFLSERAERQRKLKDIERHLFTNLENSVLESASNFAAVWVALVDGAAPAITAFISLSPFILALQGVISVPLAVISAVALSILSLFILGAYLGKVSKENIFLYGLQTSLAGGATVGILLLIGGA